MRSASAVEQDFNNDTYTDSRIDHVFVSPNFLVDTTQFSPIAIGQRQR